jgi:methionyl-tRNA formyltransferase
MRIAYMGTPDFALPALGALIDAGHDIVCVYAQPPRPAGRGQKERLSPVHAFAESKGLSVRTPKTLKDPAIQQAFTDLRLDAAVVTAYGLLLPSSILTAPRLGCLNIHASLLPRWRGAAPIQRAIEAGDSETGVTIMQMDEGLDTGAILNVRTLPIADDATAADLHDALANLGAAMIVSTLSGLADGSLTARPQPAAGTTYAKKIDKGDGRLDWTKPARALDRAIRAFTPWPGAWFTHDGARIKILHAVPLDSAKGSPGEAVDDTLTIACGDGALRLLRVQREGRKPAVAEDFLRGYPIPKGTVLT